MADQAPFSTVGGVGEEGGARAVEDRDGDGLIVLRVRGAGDGETRNQLGRVDEIVRGDGADRDGGRDGVQRDLAAGHRAGGGSRIGQQRRHRPVLQGAEIGRVGAVGRHRNRDRVCSIRERHDRRSRSSAVSPPTVKGTAETAEAPTSVWLMFSVSVEDILLVQRDSTVNRYRTTRSYRLRGSNI